MSDHIEELTILPATAEPWVLLHQDPAFIVVEKPTKLLTVPGRHPANADCLIRRVQQHFPTAQVVHRLDYDTSGIVVLPLQKTALSAISKQFQARSIVKYYQALVLGQLQPATGQIDLAIAADQDHRPLYKICALTGKPSQTDYQTLGHDTITGTSRVQLKPITGRSHQLRLHMLAKGTPIIGDPLYGNTQSQQLAQRLCLHACELSMQHPSHGNTLKFISQTPF